MVSVARSLALNLCGYAHDLVCRRMGALFVYVIKMRVRPSFCKEDLLPRLLVLLVFVRGGH